MSYPCSGNGSARRCLTIEAGDGLSGAVPAMLEDSMLADAEIGEMYKLHLTGAKSTAISFQSKGSFKKLLAENLQTVGDCSRASLRSAPQRFDSTHLPATLMTLHIGALIC
jgi:hypothetical protein